MSRSGRPSARGAHKRNLIGPWEILEQIEKTTLPSVLIALPRPLLE
jgi:hypothetical protein